jgi:hypothetical protein
VPVYSHVIHSIAVVSLSGLGKVKVNVVTGQRRSVGASQFFFTHTRGLTYQGNVVDVVALASCHLELVIVGALVLDLWVICQWSAVIALFSTPVT